MSDPTEPGPAPVLPPHETPSQPTMAVPQRRAAVQQGPDRTGLLVVVALVVAASAVVAFVFTGIEDKGIYSKPVDELMQNKGKFAGRPVRADGLLVHGTLVKKEQPCEYRFRIQKNGVEVPVSYKACIVPDTFRDMPDTNVEVTVEGQLLADGNFEANKVLAKCPSKYEMNDRAKNGEKAPHAAIQK